MNSIIMKLNIVVTMIVASSVMAASITSSADASASERQAFKRPKNVILITISTLRADHVSCLGYSRDTTPSFDKFAGENTLFQNAFATSGWMMPAHGSIWTSLYPSTHGATHINKRLGDEHQTLAEILNDNGFYCVGFCCGPRLDREHGFAQGFDVYDDYSATLMLESLAFGNEGIVDINKQKTNDLINDAAIGWLKRSTHRPFFMFVHYYDNHWDYLPPPPYNQMYDNKYKGPIDGTGIAREPLFSNPPNERDIEHIIALYDGEVRQTDSDLEELLETLKETGLMDSSIVFILGDHGEQFYEHGHTSHHGLYEELIHIPMAISVPGTCSKGKIIDSLVSQIDILPTILDYLGIRVPKQCQGKSLKSLIEGNVEIVNEFIFAEYTGGAIPDTFMVRNSRYKLYREAEGRLFAYDLFNDPGEQSRMLSSDFPSNVHRLVRVLDELMAKYVEGMN